MSVTAPDGSVWPAGSLRALELTSIRDFVQRAADEGYLSGRVLDYGCGYAPYRSIVEGAGGEWFGYDRAEFPDNQVGDIGQDAYFGHHRYPEAILCTQVLQYVPMQELVGDEESRSLLEFFAFLLGCYREKNKQGHLVLTYSTNWPEAQPEDLHRFTAAGIERLLMESAFGFEIIHHERRAEFRWGAETFSLGGGVIARPRT